MVCSRGLHEVAFTASLGGLHPATSCPPRFLCDRFRIAAPGLADTLRFFSNHFSTVPPVASATLPAFDTLPWQSQSSRGTFVSDGATLFRLTDGQVSLLVAAVSHRLCANQIPYGYLSLLATLATDKKFRSKE